MIPRRYRRPRESFAYIYGPASAQTIGTSYATIGVDVIQQEYGGYSEPTDGEIAVPFSAAYDVHVGVQTEKASAGTTGLDLKVETNETGSFVAVPGSTTRGPVNGNSKGGYAGIDCTTPLLPAGSRIRVQGQFGEDVDIPAAGMRLIIRRRS